MINNLRIVPYTEEDNEPALILESKCVQGKSLVLKYQRPTFHARSQVYDRYKIFCAKLDNQLVGIQAWAEKKVILHKKLIRCTYLYDLRVHPNYRKQGIGTYLLQTAINEIGKETDCTYTLVAGENESALNLSKFLTGSTVSIPLTYLVIPVNKKHSGKNEYQTVSANDTHDRYFKLNNDIEFLPEFDEKKLLGFVSSIAIGKTADAGCSMWTNENLLAEQVVSVPFYYRLMKILPAPLRQFMNLPYIPKPTDTILSWFLFDFYAKDEKSAGNLLATVNHIALNQNRQYFYMLLQNNNPLLTFIKKSYNKTYTFPYLFLALGRLVPSQKEKLYIDIRDL